MKKRLFHIVIVSALLAISSLCRAQLIQGIAINTTGNSNYEGAILDLSNHNTPGTVGFLPPYVFLDQSNYLAPLTGIAGEMSGILVYNTSNNLSGPGLYYWNNNTGLWVFLSNGFTSANNGLTLSGGSVQLGGALNQATNIPLSGYNLSVTGSSEATTFTSSGQVGFGNASPNAEAIIDLNNSNNWGLMLPGMTTANLPAITAAQNGLIVFNSTTGCVQFARNGVWVNMNSPCP
jgi:hypothetical protein